ncbi:hypothetical protein [Streptomyces sp. YIM 98790]|uniref:hypothetical protein n=1 Tax=Streptomyces sp. YIM 98790 TaxID=2689077 RepID=UPI001408DAE1|nr:hypothetical protein [Streptomyces sp. YIM 98790]
MSAIGELWAAESLPIKDGLYLATGLSLAARLDPAAPDGMVLLDPFDLDALLSADPDWVTAIDITRRRELPGGGALCCGEGSYGAEGFAARTAADGSLVWVLYFEESNPFDRITVTPPEDPRRAAFHSTSGITVTLGIDRPDRGQGRGPAGAAR